jgi:hypothetical protein
LPNDPIKCIKKVEIKIIRNIQGYPLYAGLNRKKRDEIMNLVKDACELFEDDFAGKFYQFEGMEDYERKAIQEHVFQKYDTTNELSYENFMNRFA